MRVKTFRGSSTAAVLTRVKNELGPEAVILSNRSVREKGRTICEVMAAVDQPVSSDSGIPEESGMAESSSPDNATAWRREWNQIKSMLLGYAEDRLDSVNLTPRQRQALEYLDEEGVEKAVILGLCAKIRREPKASLLELLGEVVTAKPLGSKDWPQKFHAFSGPSGAGKTSVMIRAALDYQRSNPGARIRLVNADDAHGKGRLVLKHYAQLSNMAYSELYGPDDTRDLLASHDFDVTFIDLPALSRGERQDEVLGRLGLSGVPGLAVHLVMAPLFSREQTGRYLEAYRAKKTASLVWTKLDEACTYGAIVNVAESSGLPVSAISYGPGLKNSLLPAERIALWKLLFKHELPGAATAAKMEAA